MGSHGWLKAGVGMVWLWGGVNLKRVAIQTGLELTVGLGEGQEFCRVPQALAEIERLGGL